MVLCSPFTLFAVLGVIRQAVDTVQLERAGDEILDSLGRFSAQWTKLSDCVDGHGQPVDGLQARVMYQAQLAVLEEGASRMTCRVEEPIVRAVHDHGHLLRRYATRERELAQGLVDREDRIGHGRRGPGQASDQGAQGTQHR